MLRWLILWRTAVTFDETTFEYVLHCSNYFLEVNFYKCLAVFFVVGQLEVTFFSLKFYYARMHGDCYMASMQWLWLEFYRKFKIFTEANVTEQTIKHSSDDGWLMNVLSNIALCLMNFGENHYWIKLCHLKMILSMQASAGLWSHNQVVRVVGVTWTLGEEAIMRSENFYLPWYHCRMYFCQDKTMKYTVAKCDINVLLKRKLNNAPIVHLVCRWSLQQYIPMSFSVSVLK